MIGHYTARYEKLDSGYMGQLIEWPGVITEGDTLEECREMVRDALYEMMQTYIDDGIPFPNGTLLLETISIEDNECLLSEKS